MIFKLIFKIIKFKILLYLINIRNSFVFIRTHLLGTIGIIDKVQIHS